MNTQGHDTIRYLLAKKFEQFGYRWAADPLPSWLWVDIETDAGSRTVYVNSRVHVNKRVKMPTTYSAEFSIAEILQDCSARIRARFL